VARLPDSIEVSVTDIPEVIAALEQAKALEVRYAALVAAARWAVDASRIAGNGPSQEAFNVREDAITALHAALDEVTR